MAKLTNLPPTVSPWPWGGPRSVRERLVDPSQFDRKKKARQAGNPKNPPLASSELLDFIGPAHASDELRLPLPPHPQGHDADLSGFNERPLLQAVAERGQGSDPGLERALGRVSAPPERLDRLKALIGREEQMLSLVGQLHADIQEVQRRMMEEQKDSGF
jgi:hypothetical protein